MVPICPLESNHNILTEENCWACALLLFVYNISNDDDVWYYNSEAGQLLDDYFESRAEEPLPWRHH